MATYQIYELSARAVMSYAAEQDGVYTFMSMSSSIWRSWSRSVSRAPLPS